jgi:hypothetical protein
MRSAREPGQTHQKKQKTEELSADFADYRRFLDFERMNLLTKIHKSAPICAICG